MAEKRGFADNIFTRSQSSATAENSGGIFTRCLNRDILLLHNTTCAEAFTIPVNINYINTWREPLIAF